MPSKPQNLAGLKFGRLTVLRSVGKKGKSPRWFWRCRCKCGRRVSVSAAHLQSRQTRSCGCLAVEIARKTAKNLPNRHKWKHGESKPRTPEYSTWCGMISRCENPKMKFFGYYGGRGIRVCARWRRSYPTFLADMGRKPSSRHSIDRIRNSGHYTPSNCRWATKFEQIHNRRKR